MTETVETQRFSKEKFLQLPLEEQDDKFQQLSLDDQEKVLDNFTFYWLPGGYLQNEFEKHPQYLKEESKTAVKLIKRINKILEKQGVVEEVRAIMRARSNINKMILPEGWEETELPEETKSYGYDKRRLLEIAWGVFYELLKLKRKTWTYEFLTR